MFPKTISVKGITIQVESWDELDAVIQRYGGDVATAPADQQDSKYSKKAENTSLPMNDRVLLQQFVDRGGKGILNRDLGRFLGAKGKAIGPALRKWSSRIGLVHQENAEAFERFSRPEGRGYKLSEAFLKVAQTLLQGL